MINNNLEFKVKSIKAKEILDSRKKPTIEVELETKFGIFRASVPAGASKGEYEAKEIRDKDGGVKKAIKNIEEIIAPRLEKENISNQKRIDNILVELDGTKDKSNLGANAILAVSIAICRAGAKAKNLSLYNYIASIFQSLQIGSPRIIPKACFNILNGGAHAKNHLNIQEFMIIPQESSFNNNFKIAKEVYNALEKVLENKLEKEKIELGDEGGFAPSHSLHLSTAKQALELIMQAVKESGFENKIKLGLDCAASTFFKKGVYQIDNRNFTKQELLNYYKDLIEEYPILFLEDPFEQNDWDAWKQIKQDILEKSKLIIIGDDLTVTNSKRIKEAQDKKACNGMILKPNQIGTVTEAIEAAELARKFKWKIMVSHRSGETNDDFISDLAVGIGADFFKAGAPATKERLVKYNRLLEIEKESI